MLFSLIVILLCNLRHSFLTIDNFIDENSHKLNREGEKQWFSETEVELAIKQKWQAFLKKVLIVSTFRQL